MMDKKIEAIYEFRGIRVWVLPQPINSLQEGQYCIQCSTYSILELLYNSC